MSDELDWSNIGQWSRWYGWVSDHHLEGAIDMNFIGLLVLTKFASTLLNHLKQLTDIPDIKRSEIE